MKYKTITSCRVCGSQNLKKIIDLGDQYVQHAFIHPIKKNPTLEKYPTQLVACMNPDCGLVQLKHTINRHHLYSVYWYRSGTNNTMIKHLKALAREAQNTVKAKRPKILDIGCNDGTMLHFFSEDCKKTGIDPSDISYGADNKINIIHDFFPLKKLHKKTFDIIASIAMYYDVDNPVTFAREVKKILSPRGLWVLEVAYLPVMIANTSYDTVCHEHLSYFHLKSLEEIAKKASLKIVKADLNEINGGSIRCYLTHRDSKLYDNLESNLAQMQKAEKLFIQQQKKKYRRFSQNVAKQKKDLYAFLKKIKSLNKVIHVYGASTKGNTILQYCNITNTLIDAASDKNPEKWGTQTPGTKIPIVSEKESRKAKPDYYLVLPWSFRKEFLIREHALLSEGTKMIFPLPTLQIVSG